MSEGFNMNFTGQCVQEGFKLNTYDPEVFTLCVNLHLLQ